MNVHAISVVWNDHALEKSRPTLSLACCHPSTTVLTAVLSSAHKGTTWGHFATPAVPHRFFKGESSKHDAGGLWQKLFARSSPGRAAALAHLFLLSCCQPGGLSPPTGCPKPPDQRPRSDSDRHASNAERLRTCLDRHSGLLQPSALGGRWHSQGEALVCCCHRVQ